MVSGGYGGGDIPVPIPNTAVKPTSADGTWGFLPGRVGRRRDLKSPHRKVGTFRATGNFCARCQRAARPSAHHGRMNLPNRTLRHAVRLAALTCALVTWLVPPAGAATSSATPLLLARVPASTTIYVVASVSCAKGPCLEARAYEQLRRDV